MHTLFYYLYYFRLLSAEARKVFLYEVHDVHMLCRNLSLSHANVYVSALREELSMEYKCQRLYRDARIFSIYEGTTQLQVVAAIRYITNGTYLGIIKEMLEKEVSEDLKPLKARVVEMVKLYEQALDYVKQAQDQEVQDFLARRLYNAHREVSVAEGRRRAF